MTRVRTSDELTASEAPWQGHVPQGWRQKKLKYVVRPRDRRLNGENASKPYVGLEHIESWTGMLSVPQDSTSTGIVNAYQKDDVLLGKLRPYLAKVMHAGEEGVCTTEALVLACLDELDPRFLFYSLANPPAIENINSSTYGAKMPRTNWEFVGDQIQLIPPREEQHSIVTYLDSATQRVNALIAKNGRLLSLLEERRNAVVTTVATKGLNLAAPRKASGIDWLGEVPKHWEVLQARFALGPGYYGISDALQQSGQYGVLRMGDVGYGDVSTDELARIDIVDPSLLLKTGDLVFNRTNSYEQVAKVGLFRGDASQDVTFASYLVRFRPTANAEYLKYLLNVPAFLNFVRTHSLRAIGQVNLNPTRYAQMQICLPPENEQKAIAEHLDKVVGPIRDAERKVRSAISSLIEYRSALITNAITGKIDVREANQREAAA